MSEEKPSNSVNLGCGTLILIGLIVMFFSQPGRRQLESDLRTLSKQLERIERVEKQQTTELAKLRDEIERLSKDSRVPAFAP